MQGLYFEQFIVGEIIEHGLSKTITEADNMLFCNMTLNAQPLHIDKHFCETHSEFKQPIVNSLLTLGLMIGISVNDTTIGTTIANLGMTDVNFPAPVFQGDSIYVKTEILDKRQSKSRPNAGIVTMLHRAYNQDKLLVATCTRKAFIKKQPTD
ncbi:MAG: MaoC family dehydratase [Rhizobiales bacterium]|nr:MaoC family dehydratase [Hyphomicrobiales bacterium]NRB13209.1 MaoC family dehydratase [Hyphomicrobiales bacterium]